MLIEKAENRIDGVSKVTGALRFPSDLAMEGMLHAVPVLSNVAHARILAVDTAQALAVPGCVAVYTGADVPCNRIGFYKDHPVICDDKVRFWGDIVAVVAAETEAAARRAARLVKVRYEELPLISTVQEALDMSRGKVHDQMENNVCHHIKHQQGNVDAAFAQSAHIVQGEYTFPAVDHCFLETECGLAYMKDGRLHIDAGSQNVFYDRGQIAMGLGLREEDVVVVAPYCGGAFGGKGDVSVHNLIGLVTLKTGRPCRMQFSREERFINGVKRHPGTIRMKTGVDAEGHILAHEVYVLLDGGAYTVFGNVVLEIATECCTGPYRMPNTRVETYNLYTNNGVNGAFRGFGAAQGCFALEGQMNRAAKACGLDPIEFRLRNCLTQGEKSGMGHTLLADPCMKEVLAACKGHPLLEKAKTLNGSFDGPWVRGVGFACGMKGYGIGVNDAQDYGWARVRISSKGRPQLTVGCIEMGQGGFTALARMAAETLKLQEDELELHGLTDTSNTEETGSTASSRITYAVGRAVCEVCGRLVEALTAKAAEKLGAVPEKVRHTQSGFEAEGGVLAFAEAAKLLGEGYEQSARMRTAYADQQVGGGLGHPHVLYSSNAQIAQVKLNTETGEVEVEDFAVVLDVGRVINPVGVQGQSEGGVAMGISYALLEEMQRDNSGKPLNTGFSTYLIPTVLDVPDRIDNTILEIEEPTGPYGAKGMAENATVPTAPAVVDAVNNTLGFDIQSLPITPEKMRELSEKWAAHHRG